ncbi:MAG: hypothetical protein AAFQ44_04940 [Pseudomonadota bacterium]
MAAAEVAALGTLLTTHLATFLAGVTALAAALAAGILTSATACATGVLASAAIFARATQKRLGGGLGVSTRA